MNENKNNVKKGQQAKSSNNKHGRKPTSQTGGQPKKDSSAKRINLDNARDSKVIHKFNDISWYSRNPELLKSAGSIPFAQIIGGGVRFSGHTMIVPGIMRLNYSVSFGPRAAGNVNAPYALNQASKQLYSFIVHANSRNYNGESADYLILTLAGAQCFAFVAHIMRAYGIAKWYAEENLYTPDALLYSMGFDPDDFRKNLGNVWFRLNELISRSSQFWIPNIMPILQRWFWMNSNVYKDANGPRAQMYVFVPTMFLQYNETLSTTGGGLSPLMDPSADTASQFNPTTHRYTVDQWFAAADALFGALIESEDRGIIYGDILKAFGADKIWALPPIDANYTMAPVYNEEVMTQIENSNRHGSGVVCAGLCQNGDQLIPFYSGVSSGTQFGYDRTMLNFHFDGNPTPEQIMIATRLMASGTAKVSVPTGSVGQDGTWSVSPSTTVSHTVEMSTGTEVINSYDFIDFDPVTHTPHIVEYSALLNNNLSLQNLTMPAMWSAFDWAPFRYEVNGVTSTQYSSLTNGTVFGDTYLAVGDYDNFTVIDWQTLDKLHTTAVYSEFGLPIL